MDKPRTIAGSGWQLNGEFEGYETIALSIPKDDADYIRRNCDPCAYFVLKVCEAVNTCEKIVGCKIKEE